MQIGDPVLVIVSTGDRVWKPSHEGYVKALSKDGFWVNVSAGLRGGRWLPVDGPFCKVKLVMR